MHTVHATTTNNVKEGRKERKDVLTVGSPQYGLHTDARKERVKQKKVKVAKKNSMRKMLSDRLNDLLPRPHP